MFEEKSKVSQEKGLIKEHKHWLAVQTTMKKGLMCLLFSTYQIGRHKTESPCILKTSTDFNEQLTYLLRYRVTYKDNYRMMTGCYDLVQGEPDVLREMK
jgi:hypothetical protein